MTPVCWSICFEKKDGTMKKLVKLKDFYNHLEEYVIVGLVGVTTLLIFYQVLMRYVFNSSPAWTEEIARFMFVWESWLGISVTQKYSKHIKIEALVSRLAGKKLAIVNIIADVLTMAILVLLIKFGIDLMDIIFTMHQNSSATHFPLWIVYLACPLSCMLMFIRLIGDIKVQIDAFKKDGMEVA